jgi:uncharacterized protein with GYD domain
MTVRAGLALLYPEPRQKRAAKWAPYLERTTSMSFYLYQLSYTHDAVKAMIANPSDRKAAATKLIEGLGGKLHHLFFAFGTYDVICLIEGPNDQMMAAGAMAVAAAGTVAASSTIKLMTIEEAMGAMKMAGKATGSYKSPMQ